MHTLPVVLSRHYFVVFVAVLVVLLLLTVLLLLHMHSGTASMLVQSTEGILD